MKMEVPDNVAINFFKSHCDGIETAGVHAARCPVCGDSEKHSHRKRLYLLKNEKGWRVYCHNCGYSSGLLFFIKDFFPTQYDFVATQCMEDFLFQKPKKKKKQENKEEGLGDLIGGALKNIGKNTPSAHKEPAQIYVEQNCFKMTDGCPDASLQITINEQRLLLKERRIKESIIDKMYYAHDGKYKQRVIIPFYDEMEQIYYFQAMATQDWQKKFKYINFKDEGIERRPEYNEFFVDKDRTVYIVEGLFDSTFVDNGVATLGVNLSSTRLRYYKKKYPNRVWIMDNDSVGIKATKKLCENGEKCVIFPKKYKKIKDLNDLAILLKEDDLTENIKDWVYNGMDGLIELNRR
jgi:DNA primase